MSYFPVVSLKNYCLRPMRDRKDSFIYTIVYEFVLLHYIKVYKTISAGIAVLVRDVPELFGFSETFK